MVFHVHGVLSHSQYMYVAGSRNILKEGKTNTVKVQSKLPESKFSDRRLIIR